MKVEIWSDVACPWCYVGKRNFEAALGSFAHADGVEVEWRSFELAPDSPARVDLSHDEVLERKYGMSPAEAQAANERMTRLAAGLGLEYHLDRVQLANTFDAHRLVHLAATHGRGDAMKERLFRAYFTEGEVVSDPETLVALAVDVGLDADEVRSVLAGDRLSGEVRADEARAGRLGISGVPFYVIDERYGVSGAQSPEVLRGALEQAWAEAHPLTVLGGEAGGPAAAGTSAGGPACDDGSCAL